MGNMGNRWESLLIDFAGWFEHDSSTQLLHDARPCGENSQRQTSSVFGLHRVCWRRKILRSLWFSGPGTGYNTAIWASARDGSHAGDLWLDFKLWGCSVCRLAAENVVPGWKVVLELLREVWLEGGVDWTWLELGSSTVRLAGLDVHLYWSHFGMCQVKSQDQLDCWIRCLTKWPSITVNKMNK